MRSSLCSVKLARGSRYDGVILDPPKFGRGPKGEVWEFYKLIPQLLQYCRAVLSEEPFVLIDDSLCGKSILPDPVQCRF